MHDEHGLAPHDKAALRAFWGFYEPRSLAISEAVRTALSALPGAPSVAEGVTPEQLAERERHERSLQRMAIIEDRWVPYVASLREQGALAALTGRGHALWSDRIKAFRDALRAQLGDTWRDAARPEDIESASRISHGMDCLLDIVVNSTSEAYFSTKDSLAAASDERYRSMFDNSPLPMWMYDRETLRFLAVNEAAVRHYGYTREQFASMTLADIRLPEDTAALLDDVGRASGPSAPSLWRHRTHDGTTITVEIRANDFVMEGRRVRLVLIHDVTERDAARSALCETEDQLRHAKPFTPPEPRGALARVLGAAAATAAPAMAMAATPIEPDRRTRVLVVDDDVDVRRAISRALRKAGFEVVDVVSARTATAELDRERFDVVVSDIHMPGGDGLELIRTVRRVDLDVPVILMTGVPDVKTAATAVEYGAFRYLTKPVDVAELAKIVHHAARAHALALLRRKALAVSGAPAGAADRAGLEVRFEQAIGQLWMAFQPIVDARTHTLFGVEALLRSSEPSMPGPQHVLDAATQLGQLATLGRRVRFLSARALAADHTGTTLFVNLHPEDLEDIDLIARDAPLTKLAPRVILEITERAALTSSPELVARLAKLRSLGFRLAVDDIGAGYSGLTSFTQLMPEIVKIDMSLVRNVHQSAVKQQTIRALCNLCHEVGCLVVGEGVETHEENDCIVELGCDLLQGYLLGRPSRELP